MLPVVLCLLLITSTVIAQTEQDVAQCLVNKWGFLRFFAPHNLLEYLTKLPVEQQKLLGPFIDSRTGGLVGRETVQQIEAALSRLPAGTVTPDNLAKISKVLGC